MLVFGGYRTIIARYVAEWGIAQMCLCETKYQGGGIAPFQGSANLPEKVSRDMGYRSDSIAVSHDMGPLRSKRCKGGVWSRGCVAFDGFDGFGGFGGFLPAAVTADIGPRKKRAGNTPI